MSSMTSRDIRTPFPGGMRHEPRGPPDHHRQYPSPRSQGRRRDPDLHAPSHASSSTLASTRLGADFAQWAHGPARRRTRHGSDGPGFEAAVRNLEECLAQAMDEFDGLVRDFNAEVEAILDYAGQDMLDNLWRRKISFVVHEDAAHSREGISPRNPALMAEQLEDAIEDVLTCAQLLQGRGSKRTSGRPSDAGDEYKMRLAKKLFSARGELIGQLKRAPKHQEMLKGFLTEAELVQNTIRTVSQRWRQEPEALEGDDEEAIEGSIEGEEPGAPPPPRPAPEGW
ncbi:MAG: hypothetical protein M1823_003873 [Watsoniomyces obsoletus]|nr:MAG: hypothetical protein M1823_003873 [Watsoniomyces obsoletus]